MAFILSNKIDVQEKWVTCEATGIEQLVTTANAKKYDIAMERARNRLIMASNSDLTHVADGDLTNEETSALLIAAYIVKDWKGLVDADGDPVPFNTENYIALISQNSNPANKALEAFVEMREAVTEEVKKTKGK